MASVGSAVSDRLRGFGRGRQFAFLSMALIQVLVLVRSALIARALGPEQYGIAATFILLQQFLDSTSDTGLNKFVVSSANGYTRSALATVHGIALVRSGIIACLLLAVAYPVFLAMDLGRSVTPFAVLAASALCIGLINFDGYRMQRSGDFLNLSSASLAADLLATIAAFLIVKFDQSYMVAIYVILIKSFTTALFSFAMARRPYQIRFGGADFRHVFAFSLPLFFNGPLLFFSAQAERLVAVWSLPARELGVYMAALLLIYAPSQLFLRFLGTIFLPILSRQIRAEGRYGPELGQVTALSAGIMAAGFAVLGPWLVTIIFGAAYHLEWLVVAIIGLTQALRFSRLWSSTIALAHGMTSQVLAANSFRLVVIPSCLAGVWAIGGTLGLACGALAGELTALFVANWSVRRNLSRRQRLNRVNAEHDSEGN